MTGTRDWQRPAVFGAFDGVTCVLGVLLPLSAHPALAVRTAVGVGLAEAVGMAAGEWQSDSGNGLRASAVIGAATAVGSVLPAAPFAVSSGTAARCVSAVLVLAVVAVIAGLRADRRGARRAFAESYAILAAVAAVVWLGLLLIGGAS